jgi:hypothetical protein
MSANAGRFYSAWAGSLLVFGVLGSCVAGSEGPTGPGTPPTDPEPGLQADLLAGPIEVPDRVRVDSILEMTVGVRNRGTRAVDAGWVIRVMLSTDASIDSADIQVDQFAASRVLQPGAEDHYLRHKKLHGGIPTGSFYIGSILDVTRRVPEVNEGNNAQQFPATIVLTTDSPPAAVGD